MDSCYEESRVRVVLVQDTAAETPRQRRVVQRDQQSYFGILLDDNNRKPICRLHYNGKKKYVSFFDTDKEERVEIENSSQLYDYAARLINAVEKYEKVSAGAKMLEQ